MIAVSLGSKICQVSITVTTSQQNSLCKDVCLKDGPAHGPQIHILNKQLLTGKAQAQRKGKKELWQEVNQTWKYGKQIQRG